MQYRVNVDFKKAVSFGVTVDALSKDDAIKKAIYAARQCGWTEAVKKTSVVQVA